MRADAIHGHLDLLILSVLARGAAHGYAVAEAIRTGSGGEFDLREGTLYPALYRLEGAGLLASRWRDVGGRRRRVYALTRAGRRALEGRTREWSAFSLAVSRVIGARPWTDPA
jgi:PadR family transcriptional regulator PadR